MPLKGDHDAGQLARGLERAFQDAIMWQGAATRQPAPYDVASFLATVERQARDLMHTLRIADVDVGRGEDQSPTTADWYLHVAGGLYGDHPPMFWSSMNNDAHRNLYWSEGDRRCGHLPDDADAQQRRRASAIAACSLMLEAVPTMLRTLAAAAKAAADRQSAAKSARDMQAEVPARTGRRPSVLHDSLFAGLDRLHRAMFGAGPVTRIDGERGGTGIDWARHVLRIAADRIEGAMIHPDPQSLAAVRQLAALSNHRIADLLEEGRARNNKDSDAAETLPD